MTSESVSLQALRALVAQSVPDDWSVVYRGPLYLYQLGQVSSAKEGARVDVDWHNHLAVYKPDVRLRLAFGLEQDCDLTFDGIVFPDPQITRDLVDLFWNGALVHRWTVLAVDGGRGVVPDVEYEVVSADGQASLAPGNSAIVGYRATPEEFAVARLVHVLSGCGGDFDEHTRRAHIAEVPEDAPSHLDW
jgi:hypothetical protein